MIPTLDDLLVFASDLPDEGHRASALVDLAPRLPADRLDAVLNVAISDEHQRTRVMAAVLASASPALIARVRAAAGQLTKRWPRYHATIDLLPHLDEDDRAAALEILVATLERHPDVSLPEQAANLAPLLRSDQLDRLITVGLRGKDRAFFLACVWDHVPDSRLDALAGVLCAEPAEYHYFMGTLASRLDGAQLAALHDAVGTIDDHGARSEALAHVARYLPEPRRSAAIAASVTAAVAAMDAQVKSGQRPRLDALLPLTGHDQVGALLAADRAARNRGMESNFATIAPFAAPAQLAEAVAAAIAPAGLGEPPAASARIDLAVWDFVKAIPHLPENLQDPAVRTILPRFDPATARIPRLTADQAAELLRRIDVRAAPWELSSSVGYLAPFLGAARVGEALAAVLSIKDEAFLGESVTEVAPFLDPAQLARAVEAATAIRDADTRALTLVGLVPYVDDPSIVRDALSAALSVPDPKNRATRLLEVAAVLPEADRAVALGSAWTALITMPAGPGQGVAFGKLVSLLPTG